MKKVMCTVVAITVALSFSLTTFAYDTGMDGWPSDYCEMTPEEICAAQALDNHIQEVLAQKPAPYIDFVTKTLSMDFYVQEDPSWCAYACTQMVVKKITGNFIKQEGMYSSPGPSADAVAAKINNLSGKNYYTYTSLSISGNLMSSFMYSIDKGRPLVCQVDPYYLGFGNYQPGLGHYVVGYGYSGDTQWIEGTVKYYDPNQYEVNALGTHTVDVNTMKNAIQKRYGYFIRSV